MGNMGVTRRFARGESVWVCPASSGAWLVEDEATVLEDLGSGYLVLQSSERVSSYGQGHFITDNELAALFDPACKPLGEFPVVRSHRLWEFNESALSKLRHTCTQGQPVRSRVLVH